MKIKVSNTTKIQLDWLVAKAQNTQVRKGGSGLLYAIQGGLPIHYMPSSNWSQGGPIIEREMIDTAYLSASGLWYAVADTTEDKYEQYGSTPLTAAMRCHVASKLGDEVEVPDELCK